MNPERHYRLEACVTSVLQANQAEQLGADRIEICSRLHTGGMTPDYNLVADLCAILSIPIRVMIRNTEKGFEVNDKDLDEMIQSIEQFNMLPIEGYVTGVLKNNSIDKDSMEVILKQTAALPVTFHKAIDHSFDVMNDIAWMNGHSGIDTILTSGSGVNAFEGKDQILRMKSIFNGTIMAGGKIIPQQLHSLDKILGLDWYHGRAIVGDLGN